MTTGSESYIRKLMKNGWEYFDEGDFSTVLHHQDFPYLVRKVNYSKKDPYVDFVRWSVQQKADPHLPKILNVFDDPKFFAVDIEKLEPMDESCERELEIMRYLDFALSGYEVKVPRIVPKSITKTAKKMFDTFSNKFVNDIHSGNIMYRGPVPVITDPYSPRPNK